jgi:hypothetical protein
MELRLFDRCNADNGRKAPDWAIASFPPLAPMTPTGLIIREDSIVLDGIVVLHRIEPHGLGDVHWEREGDEPVAFRRYTDIEVWA